MIDNASPDGRGRQLSSALPEAEVIVNEVNRGFGAACNQGAEAALRDGADFVFFLNPDTIAGPVMLGALVAAMEAEADLGACGPRVLDLEPPSLIQCAGYRYSSWVGIPRVVGRGLSADAPLDRREPSWIMGCALLVRAECWRRTGGFADDFFLFWEDVYFCWVARKLGYRLRIVSGATVRHRKSVGSEFSRRHAYHMYYGQLRFSLRTAAWYQWPTLTLGLAFVAFGYALIAAWKGNNVVPQLLAAVRDAPAAEPKRHVNL